MAIADASGESKAADEAAFAASLAQAEADTDRRQAQAEAFQTAGNTLDVPNVLAGQQQL